MVKKIKIGTLAKALLATAGDMQKAGVIDKATHEDLAVGYVSQLQRGTKQPTSAALALLNAIKRKGIEAIL
jgi:hypothetical protein